MSYELQHSKVRNALKPRREPYWGAPIATGRYVGLRKLSARKASWIARVRVEDVGDQVRHKYFKLGPMTDEFNYDAAKAKAAPWFKLHEGGVSPSTMTVADACRAYVEDRRIEKGEATAHDADKRFERCVYGGGGQNGKRYKPSPIAVIALAKLEAEHLEKWRKESGLKKAASNRTLATLKAALNLAAKTHRKLLPLTLVGELKAVTPYEKAGKRRTLYLDLKQRRALLKAARGAVRDLIEAVILIGARAGELVNATRGQFDARTQSLTLTGKTGTRHIPLSPAAVELFERLSKDKLPTAYLLTRDDGKQWQHSDWDELVREATTAAKLPEGTCLYTLRHSWITTALSGGMTTLDVSRLCGTSLAMLERHYGHLVPSAVQQRLAKVAML